VRWCAVLHRDHVPCGLFDDRPAVAAPHDRNLLTEIGDGALDCAGVGLFDRLALPQVGERPHDRDALGGAEGHVDPAAAATARTLPAHPPAGAWVAAFHQRDEVRAINRLAGRDPEALQGLRVREPPAGGLRQLAVRRQVVIPALVRDGLALKVTGVPTGTIRRDTRSAHHGP
jgi:hypothetical protein